MTSNFSYEKFARDNGFNSWAERQQSIRENQERYVKAQAWRDLGCPKAPPLLTREACIAARQHCGCDDDWPLDLRWGQ